MALDIQELLITMAGEKPGDGGRKDAVRELARNWSGDPSMLEWMACRPEFDCEAFVRRLAEQEMAIAAEENGYTLVWLMRRGFFDAQERVRRDALIEVMRGWGDRPKVNRWIMAMTEEEENANIREAVLEQSTRMEHLDGTTAKLARQRLAAARETRKRNRDLAAGLGASVTGQEPERTTGLLFSNN